MPVCDKYDINIDIAVEADQALTVINMKQSRIYFSVRPDGFTFMSVPQSVSFGYKVGNSRHSYRFVGDGAEFRFFVKL